MRHLILCAAATIGLAGCLSTPEPVFDESNSKPLAEIPEFIAFADLWDAFVQDIESPHELAAAGERGIVIDGMIVVQEGSDYYAHGVMGGRPISCVIYADDRIEEVAAAHGVTVTVVPQENLSRDEAPAEVLADGPKPALADFIRDQFANQRLACIADPRKAE